MADRTIDRRAEIAQESDTLAGSPAATGRDGTPARLRYEATPGFVQILDVTGCSLAASVYMQGRVVLISAKQGELFVDAFQFQRPMGMAVAAGEGEVRLAIATFRETVILADAPLLAAGLPGQPPGRYQHLLVPRATIFSGDIDAHDLVWVGNRLFAANTRFSCIAEIDGRFSFTPVWTPPFVSKLMPEDRCHLNGLAANAQGIAYATAFGQTDAARGWNETRMDHGVLMHCPSGQVVLDSLSMPHSPRLFDGDLYVLESGEGRVLRVDPVAGKAGVLADLPGFTRGMDRFGDILFVGLSRLRDRSGRKPPIAGKHDSLVCGIAAVERREGRVLGYLRFDDAYEEIFDVKVLPNFRCGGVLGVDDDGHRQALVLPGRAFWSEERDANGKASPEAVTSNQSSATHRRVALAV